MSANDRRDLIRRLKVNGLFCMLVCSFFITSVICYEAFCLYVANNLFCIPVFFFPKLGLYSISVFVLQSVQMYPALFLIYFIPAVVILLASLASVVQFALSYNRAGRVSAYI